MRILIALCVISLVFMNCKREEQKNEVDVQEQIQPVILTEEENELKKIKEPEIKQNVYLRTTAKEGLRLRDKPTLEASKIASLPYRSSVIFLEEYGDEITISGATGKWSKIRTGNIEGWVFGGFLTNDLYPMEKIFDKISEVEPLLNSRLVSHSSNMYDKGVTYYSILSCDSKGQDIKVVYDFHDDSSAIFNFEIFNNEKGIIKITKYEDDANGYLYHIFDKYIDMDGNLIGEINFNRAGRSNYTFKYSNDGRYKVSYSTNFSDFSPIYNNFLSVIDNATEEVLFEFELESNLHSHVMISDWLEDYTFFFQGTVKQGSKTEALIYKAFPLEKRVISYDLKSALAEYNTKLNQDLILLPFSNIAIGKNTFEVERYNKRFPSYQVKPEHFIIKLSDETVPWIKSLGIGLDIHYPFIKGNNIVYRSYENNQLREHNIINNTYNVLNEDIAIIELSRSGWLCYLTPWEVLYIMHPETGESFVVDGAMQSGTIIGIVESSLDRNKTLYIN